MSGRRKHHLRCEHQGHSHDYQPGFLAGLIPQIQEAGVQASKNRAVAAVRRQEPLPQLHKTARGLCIRRRVCRDKDREQGQGECAEGCAHSPGGAAARRQVRG